MEHTDDKAAWTGERLETFVFSENTNEHLHRYAMAMDFVAGKKVLDIACGEGYGSNLMAAVAAEVCGVDVDEATVQRAAGKYPVANLQFLVGSADLMPVPDHYYDVVVSFETIEHHDRHEAMMQEIKRVLKPGGILMISSPDKLYYSDLSGYTNPFHVKELYKDEFETLVQRHFKYANFYSQRSFCGSVMVALNNTDTNGEHAELYSGSYDAVSNSGLQAQYCLAIASDEMLQPSKNSFFDGTPVLKKQFKELEDYTSDITSQKVTGFMVQTLPYRVGEKLLKKFPFLKKIVHD